MTDREAMQQALEALELLAWYENPATKVQVRKPRNGGPIVTMYPHKVATEAAAPLRERLAQPEQEPVACPDGKQCKHGAWCTETYCQEHCEFRASPQRKPLTMQERTSIVRANKSFHDKNEIDAYGVIDDVEAAHGIKE